MFTIFLEGDVLIRITLACFIGFVLVFIEGFIVIKMKSYSALDFGSIQFFMVFWALNFCFVYAILAHIQQWLTNRPKPNLQQTKK